MRRAGLGGDDDVGFRREPRASAMARPMPRLAPVINNVLPQRVAVSVFWSILASEITREDS